MKCTWNVQKLTSELSKVHTGTGCKNNLLLILCASFSSHFQGTCVCRFHLSFISSSICSRTVFWGQVEVGTSFPLQHFCRPDAIPVTQITISKHQRKLKGLADFNQGISATGFTRLVKHKSKTAAAAAAAAAAAEAEAVELFTCWVIHPTHQSAMTTQFLVSVAHTDIFSQPLRCSISLHSMQHRNNLPLILNSEQTFNQIQIQN